MPLTPPRHPDTIPRLSTGPSAYTMDTQRGNESPGPLLVSFGNPLLDITAVVKDRSLHQQYHLPVDGQLEVNDTQRPVFSHVMNKYPVEYTAGGCALNSSRVFCWVLGEPHRVVFVGGIGKDTQAQRLSSIVKESGVVTRFVVVDDQPTGTCVALVLGACRCLCADIGAAAVCEPHHVFTPDLMPVMESAQYIYVEGYFITHSFPTTLQIAQYAARHKKTLVFNLCGSYVCENHPNELSQLLPYVDILFGFVEEYRTLDRFVDVSEIASTLVSSPENIVHDLDLVLKAIRGDGNVVKDGIKKTSDRECSNGSDCPSIKDLGRLRFMNGVKNDSECSDDASTCSFEDGKSTNGVNNSDDSDDINSIGSLQISTKHSSDESRATDANGATTDSHINSADNLHNSTSTNTVRTTDANETTHSTNTNIHQDNNDSSTEEQQQQQQQQQQETQPSSPKKQKLVVVTKGPSPLWYSLNRVIRERQVPPITPEEIVDTTGAGDSFVGGFLAALSTGKPLDRCIDCGVWTAQQLLRQKGCTLPSFPANFLHQE